MYYSGLVGNCTGYYGCCCYWVLGPNSLAKTVGKGSLGSMGVVLSKRFLCEGLTFGFAIMIEATSLSEGSFFGFCGLPCFFLGSTSFKSSSRLLEDWLYVYVLFRILFFDTHDPMLEPSFYDTLRVFLILSFFSSLDSRWESICFDSSPDSTLAFRSLWCWMILALFLIVSRSECCKPHSFASSFSCFFYANSWRWLSYLSLSFLDCSWKSILAYWGILCQRRLTCFMIWVEFHSAWSFFNSLRFS